MAKILHDGLHTGMNAVGSGVVASANLDDDRGRAVVEVKGNKGRAEPLDVADVRTTPRYNYATALTCTISVWPFPPRDIAKDTMSGSVQKRESLHTLDVDTVEIGYAVEFSKCKTKLTHEKGSSQRVDPWYARRMPKHSIHLVSDVLFSHLFVCN